MSCVKSTLVAKSPKIHRHILPKLLYVHPRCLCKYEFRSLRIYILFGARAQVAKIVKRSIVILLVLAMPRCYLYTRDTVKFFLNLSTAAMFTMLWDMFVHRDTVDQIQIRECTARMNYDSISRVQSRYHLRYIHGECWIGVRVQNHQISTYRYSTN